MRKKVKSEYSELTGDKLKYLSHEYWENNHTKQIDEWI